MNAIQEARDLAKTWHKGQTRWGGEDYFTHHIEPVANLVKNNGGIEDEIIVAYLHDILEDTCISSLGLSYSKFVTHEIFHSIKALTKDPTEDYIIYITRILDWPYARFVKRADIMHNLSTLPKGKKDRQRKDKYKLALHILGGPLPVEDYS